MWHDTITEWVWHDTITEWVWHDTITEWVWHETITEWVWHGTITELSECACMFIPSTCCLIGSKTKNFPGTGRTCKMDSSM